MQRSRGALELDRAAADGAHRAAHELDVDLGGVLLELHQHLVHIASDASLIMISSLPVDCEKCAHVEADHLRSSFSILT